MSENVIVEKKDNNVIITTGTEPLEKKKNLNRLNNLRNRPFIVVFSKKVFEPPVLKDDKGNLKLDEKNNVMVDEKADRIWQMHETVYFEDRIKSKWLIEAAVIIDIFNKDVLVNKFKISDDEVFQYYMENYSDKIVQALEQHVKNQVAMHGDVKKAMEDTNKAMGMSPINWKEANEKNNTD